MAFRCRMKVVDATQVTSGHGKKSTTSGNAVLQEVDLEGNPWIGGTQVEIHLTNLKVTDKLVLGQEYFVDFTGVNE